MEENYQKLFYSSAENIFRKLNFDFSVLCTFEIESCYKRKRGFRFLSFAAKRYFELRSKKMSWSESKQWKKTTKNFFTALQKTSLESANFNMIQAHKSFFNGFSPSTIVQLLHKIVEYGFPFLLSYFCDS